MADTENTTVINDYASLRELFMEYVTLGYPENSDMKELTLPWFAIEKTLSTCDPSDYAQRKEQIKACTKIWYNTPKTSGTCVVLETPDEVAEKMTAAKERMLSAIKKHRMLII